MIPSEQDLQIRDVARQFAQERLKPFAADWDREHRFPSKPCAKWPSWASSACWCRRSGGGAATGHLAYAMALEEIAAGDGACSTIMSVHNSVGCMPILKFGDEQKRRFLRPLAEGSMIGAFALTEPQAGSDASDLRTRARRDGDHYVLDGAKQFITSGSHAGMVIVFAVTDPAAGKKGISAFIVPTDTPGYQVLRVEEKLGQHASDTARSSSTGCASRLAAPGRGGRGLSHRPVQPGGRAHRHRRAVGGHGRAAFEAARDYSHERRTFGKPIIEHQAVAFRLADMATQTAVARQMVHHAAALREAGLP